MESTSVENSQSPGLPSGDGGHHIENMVPEHVNNDFREDEAKSNMNGEEIRGIMEVIAATGKFWHDWDVLRSLLSFWLKQVMAEYPESQMDGGIESQDSQQGFLPDETYPELATRLDEALLSFIEGPPFTLQRLCEILLAPRSIYPKLSKLALALEKNLLVTSTLIKCTDPYPIPRTQKLLEPTTENKQIQGPSCSVHGGVNSVVFDGDEEMAEAEADEDSTNKDSKVPR
uniref:Serine/threonine-protein phosphatase 4 regulatory subunit 2 n=2 Tax=Anthurium amnicola TaxID=1678845 RepID=A0A1D1XR85_9ARAE